MRLGAIFLAVALLVVRLAASGPAAARGNTNTTCMLVFGDSTVDPGNNNGLRTASKANFPPYGVDFFGGRPTGRFCDGRLATDFIAEALGISSSIPAFLDPSLRPEQLQHGVSFASGGSGYDELTATSANVLSLPHQIQYLMHYKIHLTSSVGPAKAEQIISNAIVVMSAGTNDFLENYYLYPDRSKQFALGEYQDYLISLMSNYTKEMHQLGLAKFVVVGVPPMGCLPIVRTFLGSDSCVAKYNNVAVSINSKIVAQLAIMKKTLGVKTAFLDVYRVMYEALTKPAKYGFAETSKGCCGSGMIEVGGSCKGQATCKDPSRYIFWDAVHPTQRLYQIIAEEAMRGVVKEILS